MKDMLHTITPHEACPDAYLACSLPSASLPEPQGVSGTSNAGAIAGGTIGVILAVVTLAVVVLVVVVVCRR